MKGGGRWTTTTPTQHANPVAVCEQKDGAQAGRNRIALEVLKVGFEAAIQNAVLLRETLVLGLGGQSKKGRGHVRTPAGTLRASKSPSTVLGLFPTLSLTFWAARSKNLPNVAMKLRQCSRATDTRARAPDAALQAAERTILCHDDFQSFKLRAAAFVAVGGP